MKKWRKIEGYDYEVSDDGEVRNKFKILKPNKTNNGYLNVFLYHNKIKKGYGIHRLVAQAFIPNPNNLPQVNHIDGNKTNNKVNNLEWCDASYNQLHAVKKGFVKVHRVKQYDKSGNYIKTWDSIKEISKYYDTSHVTIINCCNGKVKTSLNYIWKYEEEL